MASIYGTQIHDDLKINDLSNMIGKKLKCSSILIKFLHNSRILQPYEKLSDLMISNKNKFSEDISQDSISIFRKKENFGFLDLNVIVIQLPKLFSNFDELLKLLKSFWIQEQLCARKLFNENRIWSLLDSEDFCMNVEINDEINNKVNIDWKSLQEIIDNFENQLQDELKNNLNTSNDIKEILLDIMFIFQKENSSSNGGFSNDGANGLLFDLFSKFLIQDSTKNFYSPFMFLMPYYTKLQRDKTARLYIKDKKTGKYRDNDIDETYGRGMYLEIMNQEKYLKGVEGHYSCEKSRTYYDENKEFLELYVTIFAIHSSEIQIHNSLKCEKNEEDNSCKVEDYFKWNRIEIKLWNWNDYGRNYKLASLDINAEDADEDSSSERNVEIKTLEYQNSNNTLLTDRVRSFLKYMKEFIECLNYEKNLTPLKYNLETRRKKIDFLQSILGDSD